MPSPYLGYTLQACFLTTDSMVIAKQLQMPRVLTAIFTGRCCQTGIDCRPIRQPIPHLLKIQVVQCNCESPVGGLHCSGHRVHWGPKISLIWRAYELSGLSPAFSQFPSLRVVSMGNRCLGFIFWNIAYDELPTLSSPCFPFFIMVLIAHSLSVYILQVVSGWVDKICVYIYIYNENIALIPEASQIRVCPWRLSMFTTLSRLNAKRLVLHILLAESTFFSCSMLDTVYWNPSSKFSAGESDEIVLAVEHLVWKMLVCDCNYANFLGDIIGSKYGCGSENRGNPITQ